MNFRLGRWRIPPILPIALVFYGALFVVYRRVNRDRAVPVRTVAESPAAIPPTATPTQTPAAAATHLRPDSWSPPAMPPAESRPWRSGEFQVLPARPGIVGVRRDTRTLFASVRDVYVTPCAQGDAKTCLYFPNQQRVEIDGELARALPFGFADRVRTFQQLGRP